jgi:dihydromethanopterin reductase
MADVRSNVHSQDIRSMLAIGRRGQLGLRGELPWEGHKDPVYKADVENFFRTTRGHVLLAGPKTARAVPKFERQFMTIVELRSHMDPEETLAQFADRVVFIGGGPPVWDVYAPFIRRWDITRLPYDGEADRWFNPAWLTAADTVLTRG